MFCTVTSALTAVSVQRTIWLFCIVPWCRAFRYVAQVLSEWFWGGSEVVPLPFSLWLLLLRIRYLYLILMCLGLRRLLYRQKLICFFFFFLRDSLGRLEFSRQLFEKYSVSNFLLRLMGSKLFQADGRTDRHDEANSRFSQFKNPVFYPLPRPMLLSVPVLLLF
jgi:hypothetical protein